MLSDSWKGARHMVVDRQVLQKKEDYVRGPDAANRLSKVKLLRIKSKEKTKDVPDNTEAVLHRYEYGHALKYWLASKSLKTTVTVLCFCYSSHSSRRSQGSVQIFFELQTPK